MTATPNHTHQSHVDPSQANNRCVICGLLGPTWIVAKARDFLERKVATTPEHALLLARFAAEDRPRLLWEDEVTISEQDGVTITAKATLDEDGWSHADGWLGTITEARDWSQIPPSENAIDVTSEPHVAVYRPGGRTWFEDAQPELSPELYEWHRFHGRMGKTELASVERADRIARAKFRANYQSYMIAVTATDADGTEIATDYLSDCASHNSADTPDIWVQYWLWDSVDEMVENVQAVVDDQREQDRAREAEAQRVVDVHEALVAAVRATLVWARTSRPHGGNPYRHEHVRMAENAVELLEGRDKSWPNT